MFVLHLVSVLVSLLSLNAAAPTADNCSQLIQPLTVNELPQILGRWIFIEGFANNELYDSVIESMENWWIELNTTADNHTLLLTQTTRLVQKQLTPEKDGCLKFTHNVTITNDTALEIYIASTYFRFLQTCPDCLLMHTYNNENNYQALYQMGRNEALAASDLETFRKQGVCLQFTKPPNFHYDSSKELCPA